MRCKTAEEEEEEDIKASITLVSYRMGSLQDEHTPWRSIIFSLPGAVYGDSRTWVM